MGFIRPATPGFLVTCVATVLLVVVSFCVPYFKSVYFLKANISVAGQNGTITFGTLGYCLESSNGTSCSSPAVGYELDINSLVGDNLPVQIPQVVVKWLTYCLVLHIVALGLAAISALFGLLAHVREISMTCFSTCISGFAAAVALLAFVFDIAIFFAAKARIDAVGSAEIGNATWLTLAAWVLLFFSGCFFTIGRCCISKRGPRRNKDNWNKVESVVGPSSSEALRLDAVKAEADRKARQNTLEGGLPAFHEVQPLTGHIDGDKVYVDDPSRPDNASSYGRRPAQGGTSGGYVQKPPGTRAVDEYYSPTRTDYTPSTYPPIAHNNYGPTGYTPAAAHRQPSNHARSQYSHSNYEPSTYTPSSPPNQYAATNQPQYTDPYYNTGTQYGHAAGGSLYHTASSSHERQGTNYTTYDSYEPQQPAAYNSNYSNYAAPAPVASTSYTPDPSNYYQAQPGPSHQNGRSYTLDGTTYPNNGYGASSVPPLPEQETYFPAQMTTSPPPINTNAAYPPPTQSTPVQGPHGQDLQVRNDDEAPPTYEAGISGIQGAWGKHSSSPKQSLGH
ncbi:pH-response regulator protein palI/rim-9 [Termitomyces sp. T112]|nr:pH-response regulator protein palI/rim-9 [Termitomyces sp. T112]